MIWQERELQMISKLGKIDNYCIKMGPKVFNTTCLGWQSRLPIYHKHRGQGCDNKRFMKNQHDLVNRKVDNNWIGNPLKRLGQVRLGQRTCTCQLRQVRYPDVELTHFITSLKRQYNGGDKKKGEQVRNGEWEAEELHRPNKTNRGERDYTDKVLALHNHLMLLINLWSALISVLDTQ